MRSDRLNENSNSYNQEYPSTTVFKWNYIDSGYPIVTSLGNSGDGVMATEDKFGMIFPGANAGEWYPATAISVGAFTAAGKTPQVDGSVPATDTATTQAGLDIQMDCETAGADVGLEMVLGGSPLGGNHGLTVGTHTGYIDATFNTPDWTDFDCVVIGFRKVEDFNDGHVPILKASSASDGIYTDFAAFGNMGDTNLETATDLNDNGTYTLTDLGSDVPVDGQNLRLRINLASDGAVTYGFVVNAVAGAGTLAEPSGAVAYSFDSGDQLIPYIGTLSDTSAADVLWLKDITVKKYPSTDAYKTQG
mgnify:CR=1 FL=1|tara:strand:- start:6289 stop:7203 length:915 start_codon:yes stop_codon:yes gene_type:complete